jgi:hypothetical protein
MHILLAAKLLQQADATVPQSETARISRRVFLG